MSEYTKTMLKTMCLVTLIIAIVIGLVVGFCIVIKYFPILTCVICGIINFLFIVWLIAFLWTDRDDSIYSSLD